KCEACHIADYLPQLDRWNVQLASSERFLGVFFYKNLTCGGAVIIGQPCLRGNMPMNISCVVAFNFLKFKIGTGVIHEQIKPYRRRYYHWPRFRMLRWA